MAQHDKGLLKFEEVDDFRQWLVCGNGLCRPARGEFQLFQFNSDGKWLAICHNASGVVSTPEEIRPLIQKFKASKKPSNTPLPGKPKEAQSLSVLRDEMAMLCAERILPSHTQLAEMDSSGISIAEVLRSSASMCYEFSDFMLAARNK